jgi:mannose-6-phosphate isomerase-like protein (cupin superfamily)
MMKNLTLSLFFLTVLPLKAGDAQGFAYWSSETLKGFEQKLAPKIDAQMVANEQLGSYGKHSLMMIHREGSGEAEIHESVVDIFVVQSGGATLLVGGTVIGGKSTGPGEIRGSEIKGAEKQQLAPGDIVHIPAGLPHQVIVEKGRQLTYVIVKVGAH